MKYALDLGNSSRECASTALSRRPIDTGGSGSGDRYVGVSIDDQPLSKAIGPSLTHVGLLMTWPSSKLLKTNGGRIGWHVCSEWHVCSGKDSPGLEIHVEEGMMTGGPEARPANPETGGRLPVLDFRGSREP